MRHSCRKLKMPSQKMSGTFPSQVDVAIVGAGPAGTAAALTLLKYSALNVAVLEKSDGSQARVGETVAPSLQPLLEYLDVWKSFEADGHLPSYGSSAAWGSSQAMSRDFLFTGRGYGWHLDRSRFDHMLANEMVKRGGWLSTTTHLAECKRDSSGRWQVQLQRKNREHVKLTARFMIDASGKRAALAHRFGARRHIRDRLTGAIGFYKFADDRAHPHFTFVEASADGWWYSAPLPDHRMVVAFMSDADLLKRKSVTLTKTWNDQLAATQHTQERLQGGRLVSPLLIRPAHSHFLDPAGGSGWVAAGDAVSTFDPLSSMGVGHAIASGIHAARVAHDHLEGDGQLMSLYTTNVMRNFQKYLQLRRQYYLAEQRWPEHPFWARRHQALQ